MESTSGWDDQYYAAIEWFGGQPGKRIPRTAAHVEVKLAVHARLNKITNLTLAINNVPCTGRFGCDTLIPHILPSGYTMIVHGANGFLGTYHGRAEP
ncbi:DddA-like double-stranded DNA deaminase toxin [Actinokineospora enzanensis]|uniref:DddA-like double-stranded DNA deaminase toxin n=1 Tax=Actinokineospora enzanensis TaxID=155975 RepID=UPI00036F0697|nr:DddA-like double-stranded DNA deaminase toxin [Actinokineospora enzanensis]